MKWTFKRLMRIAGFIAGFVVIVMITSKCFEGKEKVYDSVGVSVKRNQLKLEKKDSIDVLFIGDSECYSSFSPLHIWSEFGYTSFCCATSAQRINDTYTILNEALSKQQKTKVVVLETNCLYRDINKTGEGQDAILDYLSKEVPLFKYHTRWKSAVYKVGNVCIGDKKNDDKKGFKVRRGCIPYRGGEYMNQTDEIEDIPETSYEYLKKIKKLCNDRNAELLLVSSPSAKNWNYKRHNYVSMLAEDLDLDYLDMNLVDIGIDWRIDTKDAGDHLNFKGALKATSYIGEYIGEKYDLKDNRDKKEYESWNQASAKLD